MNTLLKVVLGFLASIGFLVVMLVTLGIYGAKQVGTHTAAAVPDKFVLSLDLDRGFEESNRRPGLTNLKFGNHVTMQDALLALHRAKDDPRITAVIATVSDQKLGLARAQEIRDAIAAIRKAGKPTMLFSETMGEGEGALQTYYLAASFETIWVQPSGSVGVAGIGIEQPFIRKLLDRVGVKASVVKRKEFKSAMETFTDEKISAPNKEELTALLGAWYDQMVAGIAADRNLSPEAVKALIDKGPLMAPEAKDGKLIDALGYRDQFEAAVREKFGKVPHVALRRYVDMPVWKGRPAPQKTIAIVTAVGEISRGGLDDNPLTSEEGIKSATTAKAIRDAANNPSVQAIVLRVDSPGGSYVASDTIWREIVRAKEKKKPVIVSMGDTAASGGYFIAMPADRIFASPATITGSIGVLTAKVVTAGLSDKLDVNWDRISFGESAGLFSSNTDFTPRERARLDQVMDAAYADFTTKAAEGRGKAIDELEKNAHGRVWSGSDAQKLGLVDELGGLVAAIDYAKTKIGLTAADQVQLMPYPSPQDSWTTLFKAMSDGDMPTDIMSSLSVLTRLGKIAAPVLQSLQGVHATGPQLYMEPVEVE